MKFLLLFILIFANCLWGQDDVLQALQSYARKELVNEAVLANYSDDIQRLKAKQKDYRTRIENLESAIKSREKIIADYPQNEKKFWQMVDTFALQKENKKITKCIQKTVETEGYRSVVANCGLLREKNLAISEKEQILKLLEAIYEPQDKLKADNRSERSRIDTYEKLINSDQAKINGLETSRDAGFQELYPYKAYLSGIEMLREEPSFLNCKRGMKSVDLEQEFVYSGASVKGPFWQLPRDNQDGVGSCFANAAKNLLVSVSQGEYNASFLDMALQYKDRNNTLSKDALDGGESCATLERIKRVGFCPQAFSPVESGKSNELFEGFFPEKVPSMYEQAELFALVADFIDARTQFSKNKQLEQYLAKNMKTVIADINKNDCLIFPLPFVGEEIVPEWKWKELFHLSEAKNKSPTVSKTFALKLLQMEKDFAPRKQEMFLAGKGPVDVFEAFWSQVVSELRPYGMENRKESLRDYYCNRLSEDVKKPKSHECLKESLDYLERWKKHDAQGGDLALCQFNGEDTNVLFSSLGKLLETLEEIGGKSSLMFNEKGELLASSDLMQLAVAPACLNPANRQQIDFEFYCERDPSFVKRAKELFPQKEKQDQFMRARIALNLLQGQAVGNSTCNTVGCHINTIVGMRFNERNGQCQYKIRESQTGTSDWHDESDIFENIKAFTEAGRVW